MVRIAFSHSYRSLSNNVHVQASPHSTQFDAQPPDLTKPPPPMMVKANASHAKRVPYDLKAIFSAFLEKVPRPPGRPDTAETIVTLKKKGRELRDRLAALDPHRNTPGWTKDQEAQYYFMDFQRKWIFCRCLRINQLVSVVGDRHLGRALIFDRKAHRDPPPNFPPRLMVVHRHAVLFALSTSSYVDLSEMEVCRY